MYMCALLQSFRRERAAEIEKYESRTAASAQPNLQTPTAHMHTAAMLPYGTAGEFGIRNWYKYL